MQALRYNRVSNRIGSIQSYSQSVKTWT